MTRIRKTLFSLLICAALLCTCLVPAFAADCYISISAGDGMVGDTISLSVSASGDIAAATITVSYDTTKLTWTGGGSDNYGTVTFDDEYSSGGGSMSFSATFTAIAAGRADFAVVGYDVVDSGANNMNVTYDSTYSAISAQSTASSNSSLSALSVGSGSLSPAFSSDTTEYSLYVGNETDYLSISASPEDDGASVYTSGQSLDVGDNVVYVTCTAEDQVSSTTYVIYVYREEGGSQTTPRPENEDDEEEDGPVSATIPDGVELEIIDFSDEDLPQGFHRGTAQYHGTSIPVGIHTESGQYIVYLYGGWDYETVFWLFDDSTGLATRITWTQVSETEFLILSLPKTGLPENYTATRAKIGDTEVDVLTAKGASSVNHYIVYALNSNGGSGFYLYDIEEGTFQRYDFAVVAAVSPSPSPSPSASPSPSPSAVVPTPAPLDLEEEPVEEPDPWFVTYFAYLVIGAVIVLAALLIWAVYASVKLRSAKEQVEEAEDAALAARAAARAAAKPVAPSVPVSEHDDEEVASALSPLADALSDAEAPATSEENTQTPAVLPDDLLMDVPAAPPASTGGDELNFTLDDILKEYQNTPNDEDT